MNTDLVMDDVKGVANVEEKKNNGKLGPVMCADVYI